jgi:rhodanese-related sulfurtransferase
MDNMRRRPRFSLVLEIEPASPNKAYQHFMDKLAYETDVADLSVDISKGYDGIIVIDVRDSESYEACHIPTALSLPNNVISEETTQSLPKDKVMITYCWGPACNGAT